MAAILVCAFRRPYVFFILFTHSSLLLICLFVFKATSDQLKQIKFNFFEQDAAVFLEHVHEFL